MNPTDLFRRYQELQQYIGWSEEDAQRVRTLAAPLGPYLPALIDDFYREIMCHEGTRKVITGGPAQIDRLKGTLLAWLGELLAGQYDAAYVQRRWRVGWRHVEIGLDQVFTNAALSRLRGGLLNLIEKHWTGELHEMLKVRHSLNKLLDLDLAIIEDAYQSEYISRAQRAERLAAIGQVAGGVAHELRNPLNVVKTSVYYLLNARQLTPEKTTEHLQRIERHVTVADGVISALSNFAKMPVPHQQSLSVARCVQEALELNPVPAKIAVTVECPADLPPVTGDMDQVRIVLGNLIRNAREAMSEGGQLTIRASPVDESVEIGVRDTGVGIPADTLSQIMEPLYTTKARGLGLGLAIARAILDKNGGSMRVESTAGQGSTFTVRLPAAKPSDGEKADA